MLWLGENGFDHGIESSTGGGGYGLVGAGDVDGDGRDDVVTYPRPGGTSVAVLVSNADGTLRAPLGYMQTGLAVGRVNGDARSDVVLAPSASLALAGPDGALGAFAPLVAGGVLSATVSAALGDFNVDAMTDVAVSAPYTAVGEVKVLAGRGDGTFAAPVSSSAPDRTAAELFTDLNADGFGDLVLTDARNARVIVAINAPAVATTPSGLGYGSVIVGTVGPAKTLTITNDGLPTLAISGLAFGGANAGDFRLVSDACTGRALAAGAGCEVALASAPLAGGARTADLAIFSNAPATHVALNGVGVVPAAMPTSVDRSAPAVRVTIRRQHLSRVLKRGLVVTVGCSEPCAFKIDLLRGRTRLARTDARVTAAGARTVVVKLRPRARRTLRRTRTAKLTLRVRARDPAGNARTATGSLTLKR